MLSTNLVIRDENHIRVSASGNAECDQISAVGVSLMSEDLLRPVSAFCWITGTQRQGKHIKTDRHK